MTTTCLPPIRPPAIRKRMRPRSPSEDEETLVYKRAEAAARAPSGKGPVFDQMMRDLSLPLIRRDRGVPAPAAIIVRRTPNVFEVPLGPTDPLPWAAPRPALALVPALVQPVTDDTCKIPKTTPAPRARRRFKVPSLVFVMSLGIGFGLGQDASARASIATPLRAAAQAAYGLVHR